MKTIVVNRLTETRKLAEKMAQGCPKLSLGQGAAMIGLVGELGSGKTVFAKSFAKALGVKENITSPTFVLMKNYKLKAQRYKLLVHIDAYRIIRPKELLDLGWQEIISDSKNIVLVEWADRIKTILPENCIIVNLEIINEKKRKISIA